MHFYVKHPKFCRRCLLINYLYLFLPSSAPNNYSLPGILGGRSIAKESAPVFSMTGRSKIGSFDEDLQRTPGPGTYPVISPNIYRQKKPQYSMTGRNQLPSDATRKPGPGAHSPEKVIITKPLRPQYSFGIRHSEYITPLITEPTECCKYTIILVSKSPVKTFTFLLSLQKFLGRVLFTQHPGWTFHECIKHRAR